MSNLEASQAASGVTHVPMDVTWMDDLALLFRSYTASGLLSGVRHMASVLLDEYVRATLMPTLGRRRTETVLTLVGPGSRKAQMPVSLNSAMWPDAGSRIAAVYKHIGGLIHHAGSILRLALELGLRGHPCAHGPSHASATIQLCRCLSPLPLPCLVLGTSAYRCCCLPH